MTDPDLLATLNAAMRELLGNPERTLAWLMAKLDTLLPGDGPIVTIYRSGGGWADPSRWIGRPRAIGVWLVSDGWIWLTSAGVSEHYTATPPEAERLTLLLTGEI